MTTPPNPPDDSNENPYGGPPSSGQDPYGQNQYGQNQYGQDPYAQGQYGQPAYGSPYPGGGQAAEPKNDGVSIAAFVTGLLCCAPVSIVLGIIGIRRTKDRQRKGRWAAVVGIVLGLLGIVAWVGVVAGGYWIFENTIRPDNAEVGQCVDIEEDGGEVSMLKKGCDEEHDGEIVGVEELDSEQAAAAEEQQVAYCSEVISSEDFATVMGRDDIELNAVFEDPGNVEDGDHIVCYVEATSGKLDEKVLE